MIDSLKFSTLKQNALLTLDRFPFLFLLAFCSFILILAKSVQSTFGIQSSDIEKMMRLVGFVTLYAVPLTLAAERLFFSRLKAFFIALAIGAATWALNYYDFLPYDFIIALNFSSLLLFAVAPFLKDSNNDRLCFYWYRVLQSVIWTVIPCAILSLAILCVQFSLKKLFNIPFSTFANTFIYGGIWILIGALLFYGQLPTPAQIDTVRECEAPKPIKVILTWLLIPIALIFFFILYAYFVKAAITQENVRGVLVGLIIGYSVYGILVLLSSYPLIGEGNKAAKLLHRFFFPIILLPAAILLWRVFVRIDAYGLTVDRIFALVFALWLLITAVAYLFVKTANRQLRFIPLSLGILILLIYAGPWNPSSLALHDQKHRLITALQKEGLYKDGHVVVQDPKPHIRSQENQDKIVSGFDYLDNMRYRHNPWNTTQSRSKEAPLAIFFKGTSLEKTYDDYYNHPYVSATFGYRLLARFAVPLSSANTKGEPVQSGTVTNPNLHLYFAKNGSKGQTAYTVKGYDVFIPNFSISAGSAGTTINFNDAPSIDDPFQETAPTALKLQGTFDTTGSEALILAVLDKSGGIIDTLRVELKGPLTPYITQERMTDETDGLLLEAQGKRYQAKIKLTQWSGNTVYVIENYEKKLSNLTSRSLTATIFLRKK